MRDPFEVVIMRLRKMLFEENKHLKQLKAENVGDGYIQFKKGKIYGIELMIENTIRERMAYYDEAANAKTN